MKTLFKINQTMKDNNIEQRYIPGMIVEERADGESYVQGKGAVFNSWSHNLGGFVERIDPKAFDGVNTDDVLITLNHDFNQTMARTSNGTAEVWPDGEAMNYKYKTPNTTTGQDVQELIRTGTISGSSFMFTVAEGGEIWDKREDGVYERTITQIDRLIELGPVAMPAYPDTTSTLARAEARGWISNTATDSKPKTTIEDLKLKRRRLMLKKN